MKLPPDDQASIGALYGCMVLAGIAVVIIGGAAFVIVRWLVA